MNPLSPALSCKVENDLLRDGDRRLAVAEQPLDAGCPVDAADDHRFGVKVREEIAWEQRLQGLPPAGAVTPVDEQAREEGGDGSLVKGGGGAFLGPRLGVDNDQDSLARFIVTPAPRVSAGTQAPTP